MNRKFASGFKVSRACKYLLLLLKELKELFSRSREKERPTLLYLIFAFLIVCFCFDRIVYVTFPSARNKSFFLTFSDVIDLAGLGIVLYLGAEVNKRLARIAAEQALILSNREFLRVHLNGMCIDMTDAFSSIIEQYMNDKETKLKTASLIEFRLYTQFATFAYALKDNQIIRYVTEMKDSQSQSEIDKDRSPMAVKLEELNTKMRSELMPAAKNGNSILVQKACWECINFIEMIHLYINSGVLPRSSN